MTQKQFNQACLDYVRMCGPFTLHLRKSDMSGMYERCAEVYDVPHLDAPLREMWELAKTLKS